MSTLIIAEAGVNHNGSLELAKQLVDAAADAGADAVKFQTFKAEQLASSCATKAEYQKSATDAAESQLDMLKKLELAHDDHLTLVAYCNKKNIQFLSTPFDIDSADFLLNTLDLPQIKIPSGEIVSAPLLLYIASHHKPVIMSTGMATIEDIEVALGVLAFGYLHSSKVPSLAAFKQAYSSEKGQRLLKEKVTLLHCTSAYPAALKDVNLKAMSTMAELFGLPVGYSDHSVGITVPIAATARGAVLIEKHFTLDKSLPGPDHQASLDPQELAQMVKAIREVELALGSEVKAPTTDELMMRNVARKSLVAISPIKKGEKFTKENIGFKRPGSGVSPVEFWCFLNTVSQTDYMEGELINE